MSESHDGPQVEEPTTGPDLPAVPAVQEAERLLDRIDELPVAERVAVLDAVHRRLQDALATVDEA